jgi:hypothetical protein
MRQNRSSASVGVPAGLELMVESMSWVSSNIIGYSDLTDDPEKMVPVRRLCKFYSKSIVSSSASGVEETPNLLTPPIALSEKENRLTKPLERVVEIAFPFFGKAENGVAW